MRRHIQPQEIHDVFLEGGLWTGAATFEQKRFTSRAARLATAAAACHRATSMTRTAILEPAATSASLHLELVVTMITGPVSGSTTPAPLVEYAAFDRTPRGEAAAPERSSHGQLWIVSQQTVPTPTPIASISARMRCACRFAASDVKTFGDRRLAIYPS